MSIENDIKNQQVYGKLTKDKLKEIIEDVFNTEPIKSESQQFDAWYDNLSKEAKLNFHKALQEEVKKIS